LETLFVLRRNETNTVPELTVVDNRLKRSPEVAEDDEFPEVLKDPNDRLVPALNEPALLGAQVASLHPVPLPFPLTVPVKLKPS
jgi:hypothetical protein